MHGWIPQIHTIHKRPSENLLLNDKKKETILLDIIRAETKTSGNNDKKKNKNYSDRNYIWNLIS